MQQAVRSVNEQAWHPTAGGRPIQGPGTQDPGPRTQDPGPRVEQLVPGWGHQGDGCHPKRASEQSIVVDRHAHEL